MFSHHPATRPLTFPGSSFLLSGLISLLLCAALSTGHAQTRGPENSQRSFRAIVIACDLPQGLSLTINQQKSRVQYSTGEVTNLSAFRPGSYSIRANSPGCQALQQRVVVQPGKIHTWVFFTEPLPENDRPEPELGPSSDNPDGKPQATRALRLRDLTAPIKIAQPATALVDLTAKQGGTSLLLNGKPVRLPPVLPQVFAPRDPGTTIELAEPGQARAPFFSQRVYPGNHAIVAIFRRLDGRLAAAMKVL